MNRRTHDILFAAGFHPEEAPATIRLLADYAAETSGRSLKDYPSRNEYEQDARRIRQQMSDVRDALGRARAFHVSDDDILHAINKTHTGLVIASVGSGFTLIPSPAVDSPMRYRAAVCEILATASSIAQARALLAT